MLSSDDRERWARAFAVSDEQIERDHLISHVLRAIAADEPAGLVFYGGTALSRTYLPDFWLSEDIDFLARPRQDVARQIEALLPPALRMDFGEISWDPVPSGVFRDTIPALLNAWNLQVKMQIIDLDHAQARWPTERREIALRSEPSTSRPSSCTRYKLAGSSTRTCSIPLVSLAKQHGEMSLLTRCRSRRTGWNAWNGSARSMAHFSGGQRRRPQVTTRQDHDVRKVSTTSAA